MKTLVLPIVSGPIMVAMFIYVFVNFGDLTGTRGGALGLILPSLVPASGVVGWFIAARLRAGDPSAFACMGASRV